MTRVVAGILVGLGLSLVGIALAVPSANTSPSVATLNHSCATPNGFCTIGQIDGGLVSAAQYANTTDAGVKIKANVATLGAATINACATTIDMNQATSTGPNILCVSANGTLQSSFDSFGDFILGTGSIAPGSNGSFAFADTAGQNCMWPQGYNSQAGLDGGGADFSWSAGCNVLTAVFGTPIVRFTDLGDLVIGGHFRVTTERAAAGTISNIAAGFGTGPTSAFKGADAAPIIQITTGTTPAAIVAGTRLFTYTFGRTTALSPAYSVVCGVSTTTATSVVPAPVTIAAKTVTSFDVISQAATYTPALATTIEFDCHVTQIW